MEYFGEDCPKDRKDILRLVRKSREGDNNSSLQIALYICYTYKTITPKALHYFDLAIDQGDHSLSYFLGLVFSEDYKENEFHIEKSEDLQFKYSLKSKSRSGSSDLLKLASTSEKRQNQIIEAGREGLLHEIYNDFITHLSDFIPNDQLKTFRYLLILNEIYNFFLEERQCRLAKPIALAEDERMTHYTNIAAIHSMLRLPEDLKEIEDYKKKYPVLRLYNAVYMNDPEEGIYLFDCEELQEIVPYIEDERQHYTYLASLSTNKIDDLTMWRLYGQDGKGISILLPYKDYKSILPSIFDIFSNKFHAKLNTIDDDRNRIRLYEISYDCEKIRSKIVKKFNELKQAIDENGDLENQNLKQYLFRFFATACDEIRYLYKNPQYQVEKEFRYLAFLPMESQFVKMDEREIPHLYVETEPILFRKGTNIIIGPKAEKPIDIKLDIECRLKKYGFDDVNVSLSKAKYK